MNKNIWIGVLVAVVVLGAGYFVLFPNTNNQVQVATVPNPTDGTPVVTTPLPTTTPVADQKPDAPAVNTSQNTYASTSAVSLTGMVKPNGSSTTYWFDYGQTTGFGSRSSSEAIGSGYTDLPTPAFITGLRANTLYYYRLSARNSISTVNGAVYSFQTNSNPAPTPVSPTIRTGQASNISRTTATINGQENPNGVVANYWFEYGINANLGNVTSYQTTAASSTLDSVSASLTSLVPLTKYYFRMNGQNQFGTVTGQIQSFTTTGPSAPSKPSVQTSNASNVNSTTVTLSGRLNTNGADTTYWFEYSANPILSILLGSTTQQQLATTNGTQTVNASVSGLSPNAKYYYRLVGMNQAGTVYGSAVSFTTKK